jgi:acyl carrier protein
VSVAGELRALVAELRAPPASDDEPLELDSLSLVQLVEAVEARWGLRVAARDVIPEHWDTVARIAAYVEARR